MRDSRHRADIEYNRGNKAMGFCLKVSSTVLCGLTTVAGIAAAGSLPTPNSAPVKVRSVVRADSRSGRLVRTVVVQRPAESSRSDSGAAEVSDIVEAAAKKYEVDPLLVHSVISVESGYDRYAVSPKGAQGLMQLMPATAKRFGVSNTFDVQDNIEGGVRYLKYLQSLFPNDPKLTLAAYNAGEGAVWKYNNSVPPYRETEEYVLKVAKKYGEARQRATTSESTMPPSNPSGIGESTETAYAPVEAFVDADGRLHMRTVDMAATP